MRAVTWPGRRDVRVEQVQITLRMGRADVRCWVDDIMPLLVDDDDGAIKVVMHP